MRRIREILLNQYIGAIAIGLILAQAAFTLVGIVMRPVNFYLESRLHPRSVFGGAEADFGWVAVVGPTIVLALHLLICWALIYWLYLRPADSSPVEKAEQEEPGQ